MNINQFDLDECYGALRVAKLSGAEVFQIVSRMENLTRWISIEDRFPTKEDADRNGMILWGSNIGHGGVTVLPWHTNPFFMGQAVRTHWKQINTPTK